ncbi:MAG: DUF695 domain-containing protein [Dechloromonas sp.]|nr:MAG: DUF695 domain-containing protein [Dechloromonas sp.]
MSDHWETFPCQMGDHVAWISYDHGIRFELEGIPFNNSARFAAVLKQPDERGLPSGEEFARLNAIEDQLLEEISEKDGIQVGRVTTNGKRHFFFFTSLPENVIAAMAEKLAKQHGYEILFAHEHDPERSVYWNQLFPTEEDWQVIQDLRVQNALCKEGDALATPRPIEHWAYFKTVGERERFVALLGNRFEGCDLYESPDSERGIYTAKLVHTGLPDYRSMNPFTTLLNRSARECGGDYDGWETQVCRA